MRELERVYLLFCFFLIFFLACGNADERAKVHNREAETNLNFSEENIFSKGIFPGKIALGKDSGEKVFDKSAFDKKIYFKSVAFYQTSQKLVNLGLGGLVDVGTSIVKPQDPTSFSNSNILKLFLGWYYDRHGNEVKWDFKSPVMGDLDLYAKWKDRVEVSFFISRNSTIKFKNLGKVIDKGKAFTQPASPTASNQEAGVVTNPNEPNATIPAVFVEWRNAKNHKKWNFSDPVMENLKLYATWNLTYKVVFRKPNGQEIIVPAIKDGILSGETLPKNIETILLNDLIPQTNGNVGFSGLPRGQESKEACFIGWYTQENEHWDFFNDQVQKNLEFHAKWFPVIEVAQTSGNGMLNSQEFPSNPSPLSNTERGWVTKSATNADYKAYFLGWHTNPLKDSKYNFDGTHSGKLYGKWSETKYQPTLEKARPGSKSNSQFSDQYTQGSLYALLYNQNGSRTQIDPKEIDVSKVKDMSYLFGQKISFNGSIGGWDVSNVKNMNSMFNRAEQFNDSIGGWDVSEVLDMGFIFAGNHAFNQPIGNWDVSNVTDMQFMFLNAKYFNQPIGNWVVEKVENMEGMFKFAYEFNQPIGKWDVSQVRSMQEMFEGDPQPRRFLKEDSDFNQDLSSWDIGQVKNMKNMFVSNTGFKQNMSSWNWKPSCLMTPGNAHLGISHNFNLSSIYPPLIYKLKSQGTLSPPDCIAP